MDHIVDLNGKNSVTFLLEEGGDPYSQESFDFQKPGASVLQIFCFFLYNHAQ